MFSASMTLLSQKGLIYHQFNRSIDVIVSIFVLIQLYNEEKDYTFYNL